MRKPPKRIPTREDVQRMIQKVRAVEGDDEARGVVLHLLETLDALYEELGSADTSVARLRAIARAVRLRDSAPGSENTQG
jgi:hypothetical protein